MCFSAESSFAASGVLFLCGAYCLRAAIPHRLSHVPLALIPTFFGLQQFAEGLVWVGLARENPVLVQRASLTFLFFALCFWPFWIPFSAAFLAPTRRGARALLFLVAVLGLAYGCALAAPLLVRHGESLEVGIRYHSLQYRYIGLPAITGLSQGWWHIGYLMIVASPLVISPDQRLTTYCVLLVVSAAVSQFIFWYAFISVWCFFAAVLSLHLCLVFRRTGEPEGTVSSPPHR